MNSTMPPGKSGSSSTTRKLSGLLGSFTGNGERACVSSVVLEASALSSPLADTPSPLMLASAFNLSSLSLSTKSVCFTVLIFSVMALEVWAGAAATMSFCSRAGMLSKSCARSSSWSLMSSSCPEPEVYSSATNATESTTTSPVSQAVSLYFSKSARGDFLISIIQFFLVFR